MRGKLGDRIRIEHMLEAIDLTQGLHFGTPEQTSVARAVALCAHCFASRSTTVIACVRRTKRNKSTGMYRKLSSMPTLMRNERCEGRRPKSRMALGASETRTAECRIGRAEWHSPASPSAVSGERLLERTKPYIFIPCRRLP